MRGRLFPLSLLVCLYGGAARAQSAPIDRQEVVSRHNIVMHAADPMGAMAVGNGEFAFNFDITGLQSFPEVYEKTMPLGILSNWGWHNFPNPEGFTLEKFKMTVVPKGNREFIYPASGTNNPPPDAAYLRGNEHRFGLGRIGLEMTHADGKKVVIGDLKNVEEKLDLWTGIVTSSFEVDGEKVAVQTAAHGERDEVATIIDSPLVATGHLKVRLGFGYATDSFGPDYQDWTKPEAHDTLLTRRGESDADFARTLDATHYNVRARWSADMTLGAVEKHQYVFTGKGNHLELSAWFSPKAMEGEADTAAGVFAASRGHWQKYWTEGGIIDLSGNDDARAAELERRVVLSQYVMAVHDAGSMPPQETGLGANSWFGKFHMEMYWWHSAHWALWGHADILERSLGNLPLLMPAGEAMAKLEGCKGVKWSKMTDPTGVESPSGVGPILVWQQPHPIYLSELVYRAHKGKGDERAVLEKYSRVVFETADYMATFADYDAARKQYVLGPAVGTADEKHTDYAHNLNPTMELGYWKWALERAQEWRVRMGMPKEELWQKVIDGFAPLTVRNGVYPAAEMPAENSAAGMTTWLYAALPGEGIDKEAMRATMRSAARGATGVQASVTWGTSMWAMCAARLGETETTMQLLSGRYAEGGNPFRESGYTVRKPEQTPMYMPANGGWLSAVAMMAAGWDGKTEGAPGFPKGWKVRFEGILPMP
ncbi:MAG TPA: hypothetical protein VGN88_14040 [Phycisphaerae bacterium]